MNSLDGYLQLRVTILIDYLPASNDVNGNLVVFLHILVTEKRCKAMFMNVEVIKTHLIQDLQL